MSSSTKNDLRKVHFAFGNDASNYSTTAKDTFISKESQATDKNAQVKRANKMRTQNFQVGRTPPIYQSMASTDFQPYDAGQAQKNKEEQVRNGLDLRKSHF